MPASSTQSVEAQGFAQQDRDRFLAVPRDAVLGVPFIQRKQLLWASYATQILLKS